MFRSPNGPLIEAVKLMFNAEASRKVLRLVIKMPKITVQTNISVSYYQQQKITADLKQVIELIPREKGTYLMMDYEGSKALHFGDDPRKPCACVQIYLLKKVLDTTDELCLEAVLAAVSLVIAKHTAIPEDRIYVFYQTSEMWAYEGKSIAKTFFSQRQK